jgi:hypothetical protein
MVLVLVLLTTVLVSAIGAAMVVLADIEVMSTSSQADGLESFYAADGAAEMVVDELAAMTDWSTLPGGGVLLAFSDGLTHPNTELAGTVDLGLLTARLQARTASHWGLDNPRWHLLAHASLRAWIPTFGTRPAPYIVCWIADDEADGDGNADVDANSVVRVRAMAIGRRESRRAVEVVIARTMTPGVVRLVSWREVG